MNTRPIIELEKSEFDKLIETGGIILLFVLIGMTTYFYGSLPEQVPSHFNSSGEPDAYSGKWIVWLMPILGSAIYFGLRKLAKVPHTFNYPMKLTDQNIERAYRNGSRLIMCMAVVILSAFTYINYSMFRTSLGDQQGLGSSFLPIFICVLFGTIIYYSFMILKAKK